MRVMVGQCTRKRSRIGPCRAATLETQVDLPGPLVREVDRAEALDALTEERRVALGFEQSLVAIEKLRGRGVDVDAPIPLDIQHALHVQHVQLVVPAEGHCSGALAELDAVVQKLEMYALVSALRPGEEQFRHARVSLYAVSERVVDRLVAADFEPTIPGTLDERSRGRNHEKHIDNPAETREQVASRLVGIGCKAVEAKAVDQQMRHETTLRLARHVAIQLVIDELQLFGSEAAAILVFRAERAVVQQLLAPDIGADEREFAPARADFSRERLLQRTQRALAGRRRSFGIHDYRLVLPRQHGVAFALCRCMDPGFEGAPDLLAAKAVAGEVGRYRSDQLATSPDLAMPHQ